MPTRWETSTSGTQSTDTDHVRDQLTVSTGLVCTKPMQCNGQSTSDVRLLYRERLTGMGRTVATRPGRTGWRGRSHRGARAARRGAGRARSERTAGRRRGGGRAGPRPQLNPSVRSLHCLVSRQHFTQAWPGKARVRLSFSKGQRNRIETYQLQLLNLVKPFLCILS